MIFKENLIKISTYNRLLYIQRLFLSLIIGLIAGILFGYFHIINSDTNYQYYVYHQYMKPQIGKVSETSSDNIIEHVHERENTTIAEDLYEKVKILCWVVTKPENHQTRAKYVQLTWGKRCNKLIFISTEEDDELGVIPIAPEVGRYWGTTILVLKYIYKNYLNEYDWFLKVNDHTYVIVENLRYMLNPHNSDTPIWFGSKYQSEDMVYNNDAAGYVLSRETIRLFNEIALITPTCNIEGYGIGDYELAKCFDKINVINGDSRDTEGRTKFHPLFIGYLLEPLYDNSMKWFFDRVHYNTGVGLEYSSDYPVSFGFVALGEIFTLEYLVYHLRPYGIWSFPPVLETENNKTIEEELQIFKNAEKDRIVRQKRDAKFT